MPLVASGLVRTVAPIVIGAPVAGTPNWGGSMAGAGDVNGDGVDDFIVGTGGNQSRPANQACVFAGSVTGPAAMPMTCVSSAGFGHFGSAVVGAGDVDGDGYEDVAVGARGDDDIQPGTVNIYRGRATGIFDVESARIVMGDQSARFSQGLAGWR